MPNPDPIEHVIVLMLENRSFDHMLGGLATAIPDLDGIPRAHRLEPTTTMTETRMARSWERPALSGTILSTS